MKIKVTPRVLEWLDSTGIGQAIRTCKGPDDLRPEMFGDPEGEWPVATMILKCHNTISRADGSMWPDLDRREMQELREWAEYFEFASADPAKNASATGDMSGLADLNAARAQLRRCAIALLTMPADATTDEAPDQ